MVRPHGWVVKDVPRDGDCMFLAALRQVSGEHSHHTAETFRRPVVDHLRENLYRDAEHTSHYRDCLSDAVRTDDAYNADTEAPDVEDQSINSIADPQKQAERKWQKYQRRLQAGAYGHSLVSQNCFQFRFASSKRIQCYRSTPPVHLPVSSLTLSDNTITCHWNLKRMTHLAPLSLPALKKSKQRMDVSYACTVRLILVCIKWKMIFGACFN